MLHMLGPVDCDETSSVRVGCIALAAFITSQQTSLRWTHLVTKSPKDELELAILDS